MTNISRSKTNQCHPELVSGSELKSNSWQNPLYAEGNFTKI